MLYARFGQVRTLARKGFEQFKEVPVRKLLLAFLPFICYLIVFKFYKQFRNVTHLEKLTPPNYIILSNIESTLFFCHPHRILSSLANPVFDFLAAIPYLFHFPLPFLFAFYLYISPKRRPAIYPFLWCAGWVNLLAVLFQAIFPTAPPWFTDSAVVDEHGVVIFEVPNEAAFKRIDQLFGVSIFHGIYSKSPVKFGAFPSLHVAWPMVVFLNHPWGGKKVGGAHVVWITLAALYATHHYLIDALGGILLALIVRLCMLRVWSPFPELEKVLAQENGLLMTLAEPVADRDSKEPDNAATLSEDNVIENIV